MQIKLIKVYYSTVLTVHIKTYNVIQSLNFITNTIVCSNSVADWSLLNMMNKMFITHS